MWQFLLILSLLPVAAALMLRWWCGLRVIAAFGGTPCRPDTARWHQAVGPPPAPPAKRARHRKQATDATPPATDTGLALSTPAGTGATPGTEETAAELGRQLRLTALARWRERDPRAAASRESSRRFGMAVPPLSALVVVFAVLMVKVPVFGGIAIFVAAVALSAAIGLSSLGTELRAIASAARDLRNARAFRRSAEEDAVIDCAIAHAWAETVPPILRLLQ